MSENLFQIKLSQNNFTENFSLYIEKIAVKRNVNASSEFKHINQLKFLAKISSKI